MLDLVLERNQPDAHGVEPPRRRRPPWLRGPRAIERGTPAGYRVATADEAAACVTRSTSGTAPEVARVLDRQDHRHGGSVLGTSHGRTPGSGYGVDTHVLDLQQHPATARRRDPRGLHQAGEPTKVHSLAAYAAGGSGTNADRQKMDTRGSGPRRTTHGKCRVVSGLRPTTWPRSVDDPATLASHPLHWPRCPAGGGVRRRQHRTPHDRRWRAGRPAGRHRAASKRRSNQFPATCRVTRRWHRARRDGATVRLMVDRLTPRCAPRSQPPSRRLTPTSGSRSGSLR